MDCARRCSSGRLRLLAVGLIVAAAIAGCGGTASSGTRPGAGARTLRYADPQGWSMLYPSSLSLEQSTSGPGVATFTEITVANFTQQTAVITGRTRDGGFIRVLPPLDHAGRFPADGVAFRMLLVDGPPMIGTQPDSRFPITLSTFTPSHPDGLQFAVAKIAWDGHVVFLPGLGGNPPRAAAYAQLWPAKRPG
jgi:hypothetical protein